MSMTPEELKMFANLQEQVHRIERVVRKLIDTVAQLETSNAIDNFLKSVKSEDTENPDENLKS